MLTNDESKTHILYCVSIVFFVCSLIALSSFVYTLVSCPGEFFLCWMSKTVKTSRWSVISLSYSLLIVWFYMSLVNMLSVEVAQWDVSLLALVIFGKRLILYILLMNSSVIVCLFGFNRYWNPHKWKVLCDLILKTLPPSSPWKI